MNGTFETSSEQWMIVCAESIGQLLEVAKRHPGGSMYLALNHDGKNLIKELEEKSHNGVVSDKFFANLAAFFQIALADICTPSTR